MNEKEMDKIYVDNATLDYEELENAKAEIEDAALYFGKRVVFLSELISEKDMDEDIRNVCLEDYVKSKRDLKELLSMLVEVEEKLELAEKNLKNAKEVYETCKSPNNVLLGIPIYILVTLLLFVSGCEGSLIMFFLLPVVMTIHLIISACVNESNIKIRRKNGIYDTKRDMTSRAIHAVSVGTALSGVASMTKIPKAVSESVNKSDKNL